MIKNSLVLLLGSSASLCAAATTRRTPNKKANAVFANGQANDDGAVGFNQTITFDDAEGSYYGAMYVGTPLQGSASNLIAYDTAIVTSLVPGSTCSGCPDNWYNEGDSATYVDTDSERFTLDKNNWIGTCYNATETFCLAKDNATTCATDVQFGRITFEMQPPYDYSGALGLGYPDNDDGVVANSTSFVQMWADQTGLAAEVIIDSNFANEDSFIYFGADPLTDLRHYIGETVTPLPGYWALFVDMVLVNGQAYTTFSSNYALLESSYENLGMPMDILTDMNALFANAGFICPSTQTSCAYVGSCDEVAGALPVLNFTFSDGGLTFELMITPEVYLFQETNQCNTLITENTDNSAGFILGDPFFRNATVAFDYATGTISLFSKVVDSPIIEEEWPVALDDISYNVTMVVDDDVTYSGSITAGDADTGVGAQTSDYITYDTRSTECIIPNTSVATGGWFDSTGYDVDESQHYEVYLGHWDGLCYTLSTKVCVDDAVSTDKRCVAGLDTCLLYSSLSFPPGELSGVLGLGKPISALQSEQSNSFVQQNYVQNLYEPVVTFAYHFVEDTAIMSNVTFGAFEIDESLLLGTVASYIDNNGVVGPSDWALQVAAASWGYSPKDPSFNNPVAIIASAFDFISVPTTFYEEIEDVMKRNGFICEAEIPSDDILCEANYNCDYLAPFLPTFSISFYDDNMDNFTVNIDPSYYLLELGKYSCMSLLTETTESASFVLGGPFFRATTIQLNYNYTQITIYQDETADSPVVPTNPPVDADEILSEDIAVTSSLTYSGSVYIGNDFQYSENIAYDTSSRLSIIPSQWFDASSAGAVVDATNQFDYMIGEETVDCEMAYSNICLPETVASEAFRCANISFCLTDVDPRAFPMDYQGLLGLGKWSTEDTEFSYIMEMYLQYQMSPEITINLNFEGETSTLGTPVSSESNSFGVTIGNTTSYDLSKEWALQVTNWTWDSKTFDPAEEDVSAVALLSSSIPYIAVPFALFVDISMEMELQGWDCTDAGTPQDSYCSINQNCTTFVSSFPEISFEFNNSKDTSEQVFSVQIFPEVYLEETPDGNMCLSLIRQIDNGNVGFILGTPFFRNVSVSLNFLTSNIAIQTKRVTSPIKEGINVPYMDLTKSIVIDNTFMSSFGQYSGEMYIGEPPQGDGVKWAFSTSQYFTVVPDDTVQGGWFNKGASRDYDQENLYVRPIQVGAWAGHCQMAEDLFCFTEDDETVYLHDCIYQQQFCLVTKEYTATTYDFGGVIGFGKPVTENYDSLIESVIGQMWYQNSYCPVATFDYNFAGQKSDVTIGCYTNPNGTIGHWSNSNPASIYWSLAALSTTLGDASATELANDIAILASDYPYVAVPEEIWTPFQTNLTSMGFVCFPSPYESYIYCDIAKSCDEVAYDLPDLSIEFLSLREGPFTVVIPPSVYLESQAENQCECLISKANDNQEEFILGAPFFRSVIIEFNFMEDAISVYEKDVTSPIVPTPGGGGGGGGGDDDKTQKLSDGAIFGIIAGCLFLLGILGFIIWKCVSGKDTPRALSQEFPVDAVETQELVDEYTPNQRLNTESVGDSMYNSVSAAP